MDSFNKESGFVAVEYSELEQVSGGKERTTVTASVTVTTGGSDGSSSSSGCNCGCCGN